MIKEIVFNPARDIPVKIYDGNKEWAENFTTVVLEGIEKIHIIDGIEAEQFESDVMDEGMIADREGCYVGFCSKLTTILYKRGEIECEALNLEGTILTDD